jgi:hypothetical protein
MKVLRTYASLLLVSLSFGVAAESTDHGLPPVSEEKCAVLAKGADGEMAIVLLASLRVKKLTAGAGPFVLPSDAPANVEAIQCGRQSLVPAPNDYKVLLAGLPFFIVDPQEREAVMELSEGRLQYSTVSGEFTDDEIVGIQAFVDGSQEFFNTADSDPPSAN